MDSASTLSGTSTSAVFRAGATADGGNSYRADFLAGERLTIEAQIEMEAGHIGQAGNFFVIVGLDGEFFMRITDGSFIPWDLNLVSLMPSIANLPLPVRESFSIIEDLSLGYLGLGGKGLSIYLAYNLATDPDQLYYSGAPLLIDIGEYDPLQTDSSATLTLDTVMFDSNRNDREIPLLIFLPEQQTAAPVILFSHGLGGSRYTAEYLGEHWSARGYLVVFVQHRGSDESILVGVPPLQILSVMQAAASGENLVLRIGDVSAVIDQLAIWNADSSHALGQRMDLEHIGMAGHSFGARTTQTTSGEIIPLLNYSTREPRIKAALPLSGSVPNLATANAALGSVDIPWLMMTGTLDESVITGTTVAERLAVFPALPPGGKFELVLFEGEHHAFTDREISAIQAPRNPAHHPAIMALSTAFWDGWLLGDSSARLWLEGAGAQSVLQPGDTWKYK